mmetsp:Transcript_19500/g.36038  ORF Transcript_19500/g.36038 Transcript_19500/m.36038 type:complete len:215 (-) Transcript_19500:28-672(-)
MARAQAVSSSDDEAPQELTQLVAKEQHDEEAQTQADLKKAQAKATAKKQRREKRAALAAAQAEEDDEDDVALPTELLKEAAQMKRNLAKIEAREAKEAEARKANAGPVLVGGSRPGEEKEQELEARDDNIQLAVTKRVNGKEVIMYQDTNGTRQEFDSDEEDDDEENDPENMDTAVDEFAAKFLQGQRLNRGPFRRAAGIASKRRRVNRKVKAR